MNQGTSFLRRRWATIFDIQFQEPELPIEDKKEWPE